MSAQKWYHSAGKNGDIVVSTRIRLARNLKDYSFPSRMTKEQLACVNRAVQDALKDQKEFRFIEMDSLDRAGRLALAERHLISPEFAERKGGYAIFLNEDESVCIMLCEEDHLRIQVMAAGLALNEAYEAADRLDTLLDSRLHFAFDEKLGFLTECPTNLGTGMRASVMLHLPALEAANGIDALNKAVGKIGLTLRGTFGEGSSAAGSLYQLSNQITLGIDEKSAIENLAAVASQVIEQEK
jgi:protein arginine kinase